jgi:TPR repeat protein
VFVMKSQFACLVAAVGLAIVAGSGALATTITVNGADNIYGAGQASPPGGGNRPPGISVSSGDVLTFSVTGTISVNMASGGIYSGADGVGAAVVSSSNTGAGSISGITAPNAGYLVGVFVPAGGPTGPAPASLNFNAPGGTGFTTLSPLLDQVFFIGDGLTGDGSGAVQTFVAPPGASFLYLGISDACRYNGSPGCYGDNAGKFEVSVTIKIAPPATANAQGPATAETTPPPSAGNTAMPRASGVPEVVRECDHLTAPPDQSAAPAPVKVDWGRAVIACEAAVEAQPGEPHFQFALGKAYFYAKNYMQAARHLAVAADAGTPDAQNALGYCYENGLGVAKNAQKAFELYNKSAAAGSAVGMASLGAVFANGTFVKQDFGKALDWLEKSVEGGNAGALQQIGNMYFNGQGVPRDYATAAQYFQQAADLNDGHALRFLANMYEVGFLGSPDPEKARDLRLRAQQVDPDGQAVPIALFRQIYAATRSHGRAHAAVHHRRYVVFRRFRFGGCTWMWC